MLLARYLMHVSLILCLNTAVILAQAQTAPSNTSKPEDQVA